VRVAIYARLSRDNSGISENVDIQIMECREYAEEQGWAVVGVFRTMTLPPPSTPPNPGPGYHTMITALKNDGIEAVLVTEMTRLYRHLDELLELIRLAEK
jgi:site-specific DNA recombinase